MVDREARELMITSVRSFMNDDLTAFGFDGALDEIHTHDETVNYLRYAFWTTYDDRKDHMFVADKPLWDCYNRLLLLLESDVEMEIEYSWSVRQTITAICLVFFAAAAYRTGIGIHLYLVSIPFGIISMLLDFFSDRAEYKRYDDKYYAISPFPSVARLLATRRRVPTFHRRRFPKSIQSRQIRGRFSETILYVRYWFGRLFASPAFLLLQVLTGNRTEVRIVYPAQMQAQPEIRP